MTLVAVGLNKRYGPTLAAGDVSITLRTGTVHAIVGENGAGKSTTLRMLGGALRPDSGEMTLNDAPYAPLSVADAAARGVALVHQEITINRSLTVAENIFIGALRRYARPLGIMKRGMMAGQAPEIDGVVYVNDAPRDVGRGQIRRVHITQAGEHDLVGHVV